MEITISNRFIFLFTAIAAVIEKYQGGQLVPLLTEAGAVANSSAQSK
jgi:Flp pilus assembly protein protease CpaA